MIAGKRWVDVAPHLCWVKGNVGAGMNGPVAL